VPPLLPSLPWSNNTGLWRSEDRAALSTVNGDFTTTKDGQVVDLMHVTGNLIVNNINVVVKRSWVEGRIYNEVSSPVRVIYCDLGKGNPGDVSGTAGTRGTVQVYRSDIFGTVDGIMSAPAQGHVVLQDSFIHDLNYAQDPNQPGGNTHNDGFQVNSSNLTIEIRHNTFYMWSMNNYSAHDTATRASGPRWTDKGGPLSSVGDTSRVASGDHGLTNAGIMVQSVNTPNPNMVVDGNLFRGDAYTYLNIQNGYVQVTNNLFAQDENVAGRNIVSGRTNIDVWSGNRDYKTGTLIP
jgi:hypothetical protein